MAELNEEIVAQSDMLRLRRTNEVDLDFVLKAENDAENRRYILIWTHEQHIQAFSNPNVAHLMIETAAEGRAVGYAILNGLENPNQSTELQRITVVEKGQGYGKEAIRLIEQWVFEELATHRLWLDFKDYNLRGKHVYESVGFTVEGTLRECLKIGDTFESLVVMSVLRSEYFSQKAEAEKKLNGGNAS